MMKFFNEIKTPADPKQGGGFVGKTPADNLPQNSNNLGQNFRSEYFCKHRFSDYTYYGYKHPKCDWCGYEDESRVLNKIL